MPEDPIGLPASRQAIEQILRREIQPERIWRTCKVTGPAFTTTTSQIYQAFIDDSSAPVAVKCTSPHDASEQYAALKKAAELLANSQDFRSPEPLALIEDEGIIVMSWIEAPSLQHMCLNRQISVTAIREGLGACGEMLAHLHRDTRIMEKVLDTADFLHDIDLAFGGKSAPKAVKPALDLLIKTAAGVHELGLPVTVLHGDFKSANLLLDGPITWTIDAALKWEGAAVHDCAHFLNQFTLDLYHPRGMRLRTHLNSLERVFLQAYEHTAEPVSQLPLNWLRLQKLVILYAEQLERKNRHLSSRYLALCIRIEINRLMRKFPT